MTEAQEKAYEAAVAAFFIRESLSSLTDMGTDEEPCEYYFSWSPCDVCGDTYGGNRMDMSGYNDTTKEIQDGYKVCEDCALYIANGDLPSSY